MEGNMIALAYAMLVCLLVANEVEALKCACSHCPTDVCTVSGDGGSCYAQLFLVNSIQVQPIVRGCYHDSAVSRAYCGTDLHTPINGTNYWGYLRIECCSDKDECNREGELSLPVSEKPSSVPSTSTGTTSTSTSVPSTSTSDPSTSTSDPFTSTSVPSTQDDAKLVCHTYNSKKSDYRSFCEADSGSFCYWLERRNKTGHITQRRQGCSDTCEPEDCKHLTRHCCNTSHCNTFPDDRPTSLPVVTTASSSLPSPQESPLPQESSSSGDDDMIPLPSDGLNSSPVVTTASSSSLSSRPLPSSQPMPPSRPLPSARPLVSSQVSPPPDDNDARSLPNDKQNRSSVITPASSSSFLSRPLPSSQVSLLSQESSSSSVDSDMTSPPTLTASLEVSPYLVTSVALGTLYLLILIVLVVLVTAVCIRQRRIAQSLHDKTSLYSQSTSSTSV